MTNKQKLNDFLKFLETHGDLKGPQLEIVQRMHDDNEFAMAMLVVQTTLMAKFPMMYLGALTQCPEIHAAIKGYNALIENPLHDMKPVNDKIN